MRTMRRWIFLLALGAALGAGSPCVEGEPAAAAVPVADALEALAPGALRLSGRIGQALDACIEHRVLAQDLAMLIDPFRAREEKSTWRIEFWGKWFTSAALAYRYAQTPELRAKLDEAVRGLLATQSPDGYIGTYVEDQRLDHWDVWGRKYVLLGLLAYHELTGDKAALEAARRSFDYLAASVGPGKRSINRVGRWQGLAPGSILEPVVLLHRRTGDPKILEWARWITQEWAQYDGPQLMEKAINDVPVARMFPGAYPQPKSFGHFGQSKAYEMMSCYEGLAELYRATGQQWYRVAVEHVVRNIRQTEITLVGSGSSMERWCAGALRQGEDVPSWAETCVTVTWLKLCAQMLRLTGDPTYMDEIERTTYNALLGALKPDGSWWGYHSPLAGVRDSGPDQCGLHINCCVASGPRGLCLLPSIAVMRDARGPVVNLYCAGSARVKLPSGDEAEIMQETDYPASGDVRLIVRPKRAQRFVLSLRIPLWSDRTTLVVAGEEQPAQAGRYVRIEREWKPGDEVLLRFDLRARAIGLPGGGKAMALVRGPVVLALDRRVTRPVTGDAPVPMRPAAREGVVELERVDPGVPGVWMAFAAPFRVGKSGTTKINFIDYSSAGQTWGAESQYRVWLPEDLDLRDPFAGVPTEAKRH